MGIRIIDPSGDTIILQPFHTLRSKRRTVQLWCNTQVHEHNLVFGKSWSAKRGHKFHADLIIEFSVPAFRALANTGTAEMIAFVKKMKHDRPLLFSPANLPLDAGMQQCIFLMKQYDGDERTKVLFLYTRVIELLLLQQQSFIRTNTPRMIHVKNEYDRERIFFARDYLLTHMDAPPGLNQLASIAGINEFKLKHGFKELFNDTVFGYLANVRLEMARRALQQKQKNVTQIAFELGYASLQHFSTSFKKKFGVSPSQFG